VRTNGLRATRGAGISRRHFRKDARSPHREAHAVDMRQALAQAEDSRLENERRLKYQGTAQVRLEVLHFPWDQPRELDLKHVRYLKECFRNDSCRRLPERNHISAVIEREHLDAAVQAAEVSYGDLLSKQPGGYPELMFPDGYQLQCLHGRHRIQAAREFLLPKDKWWTVDLYLAGMTKILSKEMISPNRHLPRSQSRVENILDRRLRQRGAADRWRAVPQDTAVSLPTTAQPREEVEGSAKGEQEEEPDGSNPERGPHHSI